MNYEPALDARLIFNRFYRPSEKVKDNGLGLAIVRAICEYHGWTVAYRYEERMHRFTGYGKVLREYSCIFYVFPIYLA